MIGTGDCLWGLLDGMNDAGFAVSLTFGGRPGSGPGFAIPIVVRYLLEVATSAQQARELLRGIPIAMSYNLTMVDAAAMRAPPSSPRGSSRSSVPPRSPPTITGSCRSTRNVLRRCAACPGWTG